MEKTGRNFRLVALAIVQIEDPFQTTIGRNGLGEDGMSSVRVLVGTAKDQEATSVAAE
jgi:hypothetical protein